MSLINEALKRAKEVQQAPQSGSASGPQMARFQPAPSHPTTGILPSVTLALVAMLAFIVVWQWIHLRNIRGTPSPTRSVTAQAKPNLPRQNSPAPPTQTAAKTAIAPQPVRPVPVPVPAPNATKPVAVPQAPVAPVASGSTNAADKTAANPSTVAKEAPPKPLVLKLQAIVTHPTRPSAVINGKSLFVGDHISEFRVSKISPQNVTLVKAGKSTVLSLRE